MNYLLNSMLMLSIITLLFPLVYNIILPNKIMNFPSLCKIMNFPSLTKL